MAAFNTIAIIATAAFILLGSADAQISSGYATYSNSNGGVCSSVSSSLPAVAMNAAQFANGAACGECIQVTGDGNGAGTTPVSTATYVAVINNVCSECNYGDIDLQESGNGKYGISWSFTSCPGSGRKLIEAPFKGDTTVYTGFAHLGLTSKTASTPQQAVEQAVEQTSEQEAEQPASSLAETEVEATSAQSPVSVEAAAVESTSEPVTESQSTDDGITLTNPEHLQPSEKTEEAVQITSRRLLRN